MDAAVGDQALDGLARDLAAERIEAGEDDRAGRVVDDQLDAGRGLERADVAPFAADDAALEVVARQVDDRDGGLDGVLGGAALDGVGDDLLRPHRGGLARLGLEPLDQVGGVAPGVALELPQQQLARFVGAQAGDALQLALALGEQLLALARGWPRPPASRAVSALLAAAQILLEAVGRGQAVGERARLVGERCSSAEHLLAPLAQAAARPRRRCACAFSRASSAASLRSVSASRSACSGASGVLSFGLRQQLLDALAGIVGGAVVGAIACCDWRGRRDRATAGMTTSPAAIITDSIEAAEPMGIPVA